MDSPSLSRERFLALAAAVPGLVAAAPAQTPESLTAPKGKLLRSLVLSGGGALGAYEAGAIQTLVEQTGVREGQALPNYGIVCGTSIGAFNAYLVGTGQYGLLRNLWSLVARENVIRLKPKFAKITDSSSGVIDRFWQAVGLAVGVTKDTEGVIDGDYLRQWLKANFDFSRPAVIPIVWAATNLNAQRAEYFYLLPPEFDPVRRDRALTAIGLSVGRESPLREVDPNLIVDELRASAAVPVGFDPVVLPSPEGKPAKYVDGGVTANTPVGVARAVSSSVDAVLLSPPFTRATYHDAVQIISGSFGTMQRTLMYDAMRMNYLETFLLRSIRNHTDASARALAAQQGISFEELRRFSNLLYDTNFFVLRPPVDLPISLFGFSDGAAVTETYAMGQRAAAAGFEPFDYEKFVTARG